MMRLLKTYLGTMRSCAPVLMCFGALIGTLISRYIGELRDVLTPINLLPIAPIALIMTSITV